MHVLCSIVLILLLSLCSGATAVIALDAETLITLKRAGIRDDTIQVLVEEKSFETAAITVPEIVALKQAGVSDETIQVVVREGSFMKERQPIIYGKDIKPSSFATVSDLIELKRAGLSDDVIRAVVVSGSADRSDRERQQAWDMLNSMGLVLDLDTYDEEHSHPRHR